MYLNTHTYYSLRYGTISPKSLLEQAFQLGVSTLVLTDINSTSANLEFVQLAKNLGIKPVLGVDLNIFEKIISFFKNIVNSVRSLIDNSGYEHSMDLLNCHLHD